MADKGEYNSIHDGPTIDAAVTRASEGGPIDAAINAKPNPNLLDNGYFGNPVNQRGQASYTDTGYWIDRWYLGTDGGVCLVEDGYIRTVMSGSWFNFEQKVDNFADLKGKTVTASALVDGNIAIIIGIGSNRYPFSVSHSGSKSIISLTFAVPDDSETLQFICQPQDKNGASIYAAKLELGSQQTLAHQDADGNWVLNEIPDYGEQLARCQRYFQLYSSADNRPSKAVDCRPVMRADPAQGTTVINGTTYYYNTADL